MTFRNFLRKGIHACFNAFFRILRIICHSIRFHKILVPISDHIHAFFKSNTFVINTRIKLAKNLTNAKQLSEFELLLFANYSNSSSTLSSKNNRTCSKKKQDNKCVCIHGIIQLIIIKMKMKNRLYRYDTTRPSCRHGFKYNTYKKCLTKMMLTHIKQQHLTNI